MYALILQLSLGLLRMRRGSRVNHQALRIGHIGQQREQMQIVNEYPGCILAAPKMDPAPFGKYFSYRSWSGRPSIDGCEIDSTSGTVLR